MASARHLHLAVSSLLLLLLLLSAVPAATAQETDDEKEFSYVCGAENGPENWGEIKPEWATCGTGRAQSPIDLSDQCARPAPDLGYLDCSYSPAEASLVNRGHDIMVRFDDGAAAGSLRINGTAYRLKQLHWHLPTEHSINGSKYDMELHMVHQSADNKVAVIGILYKIGTRDAFLHKLEPYLKMMAHQTEVKAGLVDPRVARGEGVVYYRYMGSLTTPPCTEGVVWTVVKRIGTVAAYQLDLLREAVHDGMEENARPLQKLNKRDISIFQPYYPHEHYYADH